MYLRLGNTLADGTKTYTEAIFPEDATLATALKDVNDFWGRDDHQPTGEYAHPRWVASDSPGLAAVLAEQYGCEVRELDLEHSKQEDSR